MEMQIGLRWILILISVVVLGLIVFDGWRRIKRQQKNKNRRYNSILSEFTDDGLVTETGTDDLPVDDFNEYDEFVDEVLVDNRVTRSTPTITDYSKPEDEPEDHPASSIPETIFILNILANPGVEFNGAQLLPTLLSLGLRYGDMSIFHRHEHINGTGEVLFSLVSATEPGIFNLNTMESQTFTGLTLFLRMPGPTHPMNAINLMVQTTKRLAKMLDGVICDETREPISESALEQRYNFRMRQIIGRI